MPRPPVAIIRKLLHRMDYKVAVSESEQTTETIDILLWGCESATPYCGAFHGQPKRIQSVVIGINKDWRIMRDSE